MGGDGEVHRGRSPDGSSDVPTANNAVPQYPFMSHSSSSGSGSSHSSWAGFSSSSSSSSSSPPSSRSGSSPSVVSTQAGPSSAKVSFAYAQPSSPLRQSPPQLPAPTSQSSNHGKSKLSLSKLFQRSTTTSTDTDPFSAASPPNHQEIESANESYSKGPSLTITTSMTDSLRKDSPSPTRVHRPLKKWPHKFRRPALIADDVFEPPKDQWALTAPQESSPLRHEDVAVVRRYSSMPIMDISKNMTADESDESVLSRPSTPQFDVRRSQKESISSRVMGSIRQRPFSGAYDGDGSDLGLDVDSALSANDPQRTMQGENANSALIRRYFASGGRGSLPRPRAGENHMPTSHFRVSGNSPPLPRPSSNFTGSATSEEFFQPPMRLSLLDSMQQEPSDAPVLDGLPIRRSLGNFSNMQSAASLRTRSMPMLKEAAQSDAQSSGSRGLLPPRASIQLKRSNPTKHEPVKAGRYPRFSSSSDSGSPLDAHATKHSPLRVSRLDSGDLSISSNDGESKWSKSLEITRFAYSTAHSDDFSLASAPHRNGQRSTPLVGPRPEVESPRSELSINSVPPLHISKFNVAVSHLSSEQLPFGSLPIEHILYERHEPRTVLPTDGFPNSVELESPEVQVPQKWSLSSVFARSNSSLRNYSSNGPLQKKYSLPDFRTRGSTPVPYLSDVGRSPSTSSAKPKRPLSWSRWFTGSGSDRSVERNTPTPTSVIDRGEDSTEAPSSPNASERPEPGWKKAFGRIGGLLSAVGRSYDRDRSKKQSPASHPISDLVDSPIASIEERFEVSVAGAATKAGGRPVLPSPGPLEHHAVPPPQIVTDLKQLTKKALSDGTRPLSATQSYIAALESARRSVESGSVRLPAPDEHLSTRGIGARVSNSFASEVISTTLQGDASDAFRTSESSFYSGDGGNARRTWLSSAPSGHADGSSQTARDADGSLPPLAGAGGGGGGVGGGSSAAAAVALLLGRPSMSSSLAVHTYRATGRGGGGGGGLASSASSTVQMWEAPDERSSLDFVGGGTSAGSSLHGSVRSARAAVGVCVAPAAYAVDKGLNAQPCAAAAAAGGGDAAARLRHGGYVAAMAPRAAASGGGDRAGNEVEVGGGTFRRRGSDTSDEGGGGGGRARTRAGYDFDDDDDDARRRTLLAPPVPVGDVDVDDEKEAYATVIRKNDVLGEDDPYSAVALVGCEASAAEAAEAAVHRAGSHAVWRDGPRVVEVKDVGVQCD
ncbi:hypothetical protein DFJ73DRAFT_796032 [Zopfochytrium polystomum]|nr:hypothetical protein DFJ73DRAFT_796032 [Zopfochytrium polystomum]